MPAERADVEHPRNLRVLTIWQPWASLIVHGPKRIENRTRKPWSRLHGQLIGIHAGARIDTDTESDYATRYQLPAPLPHGALLGVARIIGTVEKSDDPWFFGPVGIKLADVVAFSSPVPMRGAQSYWSPLKRLNDAQREHWHERAAIRQYHGDMAPELGSWWALFDVLRPRRTAQRRHTASTSTSGTLPSRSATNRSPG